MNLNKPLQSLLPKDGLEYVFLSCKWMEEDHDSPEWSIIWYVQLTSCSTFLPFLQSSGSNDATKVSWPARATTFFRAASKLLHGSSLVISSASPTMVSSFLTPPWRSPAQLWSLPPLVISFAGSTRVFSSDMNCIVVESKQDLTCMQICIYIRFSQKGCSFLKMSSLDEINEINKLNFFCLDGPVQSLPCPISINRIFNYFTWNKNCLWSVLWAVACYFLWTLNTFELFLWGREVYFIIHYQAILLLSKIRFC